MKSFSKISLFCFVILLSGGASALQKHAGRSLSAKDMNGFYLGGIFGSMSGDLKLSGDISGHGTTDRDSQYLGLRGSYFNFTSSDVGFIGRLDLAPKVAGSGWADYVFLRPQANIAFQIDRGFFFGGLNLNKFLSKFEDAGLGLGWQIGAGFNFSNDWLGEVQYISSTHSYTVDSIDVDVTFKSIDFSLEYRF